ncbi:MAG: SAM-dependent chlorinase/fluorinase, partial [Verrucomicrobia bacterium]|nr:SAM-dependent chlorinase/fluorinase [Verrucomicrobiota bacterium]
AGTAVLRGLQRTYGDVPSGSPLAYAGSSGRMEIAIRDGSAEKELDLRRGIPIILRSIP